MNKNKYKLNKKTNHHFSKNKNKTIKNKNIISNNIIESDILCIGAGVSSAYMCYQLKEQCGIKSKINVIESEPILGGRLKSEYTNLYSNNKGVVYDELGGMRLFKDESMKKIFDLLKKFKSVKRIKEQTEEEIAMVVGVSKAKKIFEYYKGNL